MKIKYYYSQIRDKFPIIFAILSQIISLLIIIRLSGVFPSGHPVRFLFGQIGLSYFFSQFIFRLPHWWGWIAAVFPLIILISLKQEIIPDWMYLVCFIVFSLVFTNTLFDRVPLYLTNKVTNIALVELCNRFNVKSFIDLGSGLGGVTRALATRGRRSVGVESAPISWFISLMLAKLSGKGELLRKNIWDFNLTEYNAVYVFLSPVPMLRVYEKFKAETKKGSILISNSFKVPGVEHIEVVILEDQRRTKLYIYKN